MSYLTDLLGNSYKEGMTEEELSAAIQIAVEAQNKSNAAELEKLKTSLSKSNSEAADYKKQLRQRQSEAEIAEAEKAKEFEELKTENADLKRTISLTSRTAQLIEKGYEKELAESTAQAMLDGDMDTVLKNQDKYLEAREATILGDKMRSTARPPAGSSESTEANIKEKLDEAKKNGTAAEVAYYTRLLQQNEEE